MDSIKDLILTMQKRPGFYPGCNYISCLKAYLNGWYHRRPDDVSDLEIMSHFRVWLGNRYSITNETQGWCSIILFYSRDECDALSNFFELFNEFLEEQNLHEE
jgi:hypothetical protein